VWEAAATLAAMKGTIARFGSSRPWVQWNSILVTPDLPGGSRRFDRAASSLLQGEDGISLRHLHISCIFERSAYRKGSIDRRPGASSLDGIKWV
jgi:hypothetical protein